MMVCNSCSIVMWGFFSETEEDVGWLPYFLGVTFVMSGGYFYNSDNDKDKDIALVKKMSVGYLMSRGLTLTIYIY